MSRRGVEIFTAERREGVRRLETRVERRRTIQFRGVGGPRSNAFGRTESSQWRRFVVSFLRDPDARVFIYSPSVVGEGQSCRAAAVMVGSDGGGGDDRYITIQ